MTVSDFIAALTALPFDAPVCVPVDGGAAYAPATVEAVELRVPHPGWEDQTGLTAAGFGLGSGAALYHERLGAGLVSAVVVHGGCWVMGRHGVASAGGMTPASPRPGG